MGWPLLLVALAAAVLAPTCRGGGGASASAGLEFSVPTKLPLVCPKSVCRFGGSTQADSFVSFQGRLDRLIGAVNRTAVFSSDAGASFQVIPPAQAKTSLAQSVVGPGMPFKCGDSQLCTTGNAELNASAAAGPARGDKLSLWTVGSWSEVPHREVVAAPGLVSWQLPNETGLCLLSGYSGTVLVVGGVYLKTMIISTNCTKPKKGWGTYNDVDIHLFESDDGRAWRWRSLVAAGKATVGEEGANENDMVVTADGNLLVVFRTDGGDGYPDHTHKPFMKVRSTDQGLTWSKPVSLPPGVLSARPQLLLLAPKGPLLLTGGRPLLMLWVSADGNGNSWEAVNIAAQHNAKVGDPSLRYCAAFANGTSTWLESTCYNSLQPITPHPTTGAPRALLCYDRMGTEPPAAPPQCQPDEVMTFCMQLTHSAFLGGGPE